MARTVQKEEKGTAAAVFATHWPVL